jgi:hypothetical protein
MRLSLRTVRIALTIAMTDNPDQQARFAAFQQGLQQLGWTDGRNVRIDYRWGAGNADDIRKYTAGWSPSHRTSHHRRRFGTDASGDPRRTDRVRGRH